MLFNSLVFIVFSLVFFCLWPLFKKKDTPRWFFLSLMSFIFYGWWDWRFLFLLIGSGLIDFYAGLLIERYPKHKVLFLILSMTGNIGTLFAFKYSGFFAENASVMLSFFGYDIDLKSSIPDFVRVLPVGISFYTFQSMSYTIDIYKGELKPTSNVLHFFAYLALFPQLVAGPIVRAADLLPQMVGIPKTTESVRWEGFVLIAKGFFKKMVIADNLAPLVASGFNDPSHPSSTFYWWFYVSAFAFQIYGDFSGYSDIARGLAKWMGYDFMVNFNHPYSSKSLKEFWSRWHISLSTWFRDYVYIPLGGSRCGKWHSTFNMFLTMVISGFWHGANWTFILWGAFHGFMLGVERITKWPQRLQKIPLGGTFCTIIVIIQVLVGWVFFRSKDVHEAFFILNCMFIPQGSIVNFAHSGILILSLIIGREIYVRYNISRLLSFTKNNVVYEIVFFACIMAAIIFFRGQGNSFIYFQF